MLAGNVWDLESTCSIRALGQILQLLAWSTQQTQHTRGLRGGPTFRDTLGKGVDILAELYLKPSPTTLSPQGPDPKPKTQQLRFDHRYRSGLQRRPAECSSPARLSEGSVATSAQSPFGLQVAKVYLIPQEPAFLGIFVIVFI